MLRMYMKDGFRIYLSLGLFENHQKGLGQSKSNLSWPIYICLLY